MTEATSQLNSFTAATSIAPSSKLELQLDFLARELQLERKKRQKLQSKISELSHQIQAQRQETEREFNSVHNEKLQREANVKPADLDVAAPHNLAKGFISL